MLSLSMVEMMHILSGCIQEKKKTARQRQEDTQIRHVSIYKSYQGYQSQSIEPGKQRMRSLPEPLHGFLELFEGVVL